MSEKFKVKVIIDMTYQIGRGMIKGVSQFARENGNWEFNTGITLFVNCSFVYKTPQIDPK